MKFVISLFISLVITSLPLAAGAQSAQGSGYVLLLNSANHNETWALNMHHAVSHRFAGEVVDVINEDLSISVMPSMAEVENMRDSLRAKYPRKPKAVVCLAYPALLLSLPLLDDLWKDVSVVLCDVRDSIPAKVEYVLAGAPCTPKELISLRDMAKKYNLTAIKRPYYVRETIELMQRLLPKMNKVALIHDSRFINLRVREDVSSVVNKSFPELKFVSVNSGSISLENLFDSLSSYDNTVGMIYVSWRIGKKGDGDERFLNARLQNVIPGMSRTPVFTLTDIDTKSGNFAGGYFVGFDEFASKVNGALYDIIRGREAREIPIIRAGEPGMFLNYQHLNQHNIDLGLYPSGATYYLRPPNFWERNKVNVSIVAGVLLLIMVLLAVQLRLFVQRQKLRIKELKLSTRYRQLINNMPLVYIRRKVLRGRKGNVYDSMLLDVNTAFESLFGVSREKVVGQVLGSAKGESAALDALRADLNDDTSHKEGEIITLPDRRGGDRHYYRLVFTDDEDRDVAEVFLIDATETFEAQIKAEEFNKRYRLVQQASRMSIWTLDLGRDEMDCDVEFMKDIMKFDAPHIIMSKAAFLDHIHPDDIIPMQETLENLISGRSDVFFKEFRIMSPSGDGSVVWAASYAIVGQRDSEGKPLMVVGASMNINERKKLEVELIEARDKAEEANRLKSAFLANMSHEIRTPLNAIVGFSSIVATTDDEEEKKEYVSIIETNNRLLLQLINDILDLSKIEAGTLEFTPAAVNIDTMLSEIAQSSRVRLANDRVEISIGETVPGLCILSDKNRLTQVISNFVNNAIKFTQEGDIEMGCRKTEDGGNIMFYVKDTGVGIPSEDRKEIFKRFVKLDSFKQGTGLGLPICESIISRLGGEIGVESEVGKGSTFWFSIPLIACEVPAGETTAEVTGPIETLHGKPVVLVAEDDPSNYRLFESILCRDYKLVHAENGGQAVEMFKIYSPHLVIMDIKMPGMNGYEATEKIREISKNVPIIAVTAHAFEGDEDKVMKSGFNGYVSKPISAPTLKNKIVDLLKHKLIIL